MDLLTDLLQASGVRGSVGNRIEAGGDWGLRLALFPGAAVHAVTQGSAWLTVPGLAPQRLTAGDVVLVSPGTIHCLTSGPQTPATLCDREDAARARAVGGVVSLGAGPADTRIVTVHYQQDPAVRTPVLSGLVGVVHVGAATGAGHLEDTVRILSRELAEPGMATSIVLDRMVDVLLVEFLRAWALAQAPAPHGSWLAGLSDPIVSDALTMLHQTPEQAWTTSSLAARIAVSRATLTRRFGAALNTTPAGYLLLWRMDLAAVRLRDTNDPIQAIARSAGYASLQAFSRAFTRSHQQTPGRYRVGSRSAIPAGDSLAI